MANLAITGIFTETSNIPSSGTATYSGGMSGLYSLTGESHWIVLAGDAFFAVNCLVVLVVTRDHGSSERRHSVEMNPTDLPQLSKPKFSGSNRRRTSKLEL